MNPSYTAPCSTATSPTTEPTDALNSTDTGYKNSWACTPQGIALMEAQLNPEAQADGWLGAQVQCGGCGDGECDFGGQSSVWKGPAGCVGVNGCVFWWGEQCVKGPCGVVDVDGCVWAGAGWAPGWG